MTPINYTELSNSIEINKIVQRTLTKNGLNNSSYNQEATKKLELLFNHEIKTSEVTHQKASGRCWLFAGLNLMRHHIENKLEIKKFELSQNYMMFFDKLEKANYFLHIMVEYQGENMYESRLLNTLITSPLQDGGQWDMFVNLIKKYGVVPKNVMPETFHSSSTNTLNYVLNLKLKEGAKLIRESEEFGEEHIEPILKEIYKILVLTLGQPPMSFDFNYKGKNGVKRKSDLTPHTFYTRYLGDFGLDDYVSLINSPTTDKPFNKTYTVDNLNNVVEGKDILYLNIDIETMKSLTKATLKEKELVWFGADVMKFLERKEEVMDINNFKYGEILDTDIKIDKDFMIDYRLSTMTHAMVFTGYHSKNNEILNWKVENSWGAINKNKGYLVMSDEWFDHFVYQVVIKKEHLSDELREALNQDPIHLPLWDPMGSLAMCE